MDELGVHQIEAGFPIVSNEERRSISAIVKENLNADILALSRTRKEDIDMAIDCDVDGIITFMGTSDLHLKHKFKKTKEEILNICISSIEHAKDHGLFVAFSAEDATRTDINFLKEIYKKAEDYGVDRVHIADTVGAISPHAMAYMVGELKKDLKTEISSTAIMTLEWHYPILYLVFWLEMCCFHHSNGLENVPTTFLEELVMTLLLIYGVDLKFNISIFYELSRLVEN